MKTSQREIAPGDELGPPGGEFILRERLDEGSFGAVYLAEQPALSRAVVVKVLRATLQRDEGFVARFFGEARVAARLSHPYAAHVYGFGADNGVCWMALEYVPGRNLYQTIEEAQPWALHERLAFFERICEVVQAAHDLGILHRDLKPENIMVQRHHGSALPKLLDFGIAKVQAAAEPAAHVTNVANGPHAANIYRGGAYEPAEHAAPGELWGSPYHLAPECWQSPMHASVYSDVYSLGVILCELVSGKPPFDGLSVAELARAHREIPPDLTALMHHTPALADVVQRCLAKDPKARIDSAFALGQAVARVRNAVEMRASFATLSAPISRTSPLLRHIVFAAAGATFLSLATALAWWLF